MTADSVAKKIVPSSQTKEKNKRIKVNKREKKDWQKYTEDFLDFLGLLLDSRSIMLSPPARLHLPSLFLSLGQFIEHTSGMRGLLTLDRAGQPNGQPRCIAGGT